MLTTPEEEFSDKVASEFDSLFGDLGGAAAAGQSFVDQYVAHTYILLRIA
jgi:hypothetical protein